MVLTDILEHAACLKLDLFSASGLLFQVSAFFAKSLSSQILFQRSLKKWIHFDYMTSTYNHLGTLFPNLVAISQFLLTWRWKLFPLPPKNEAARKTCLDTSLKNELFYSYITLYDDNLE